MNIIDLLLEDHEKLTNVMNRFQNMNDNFDKKEYDQLFQEFKKLFNEHDEVEDKVLYPELEKHDELKKLALKGMQAHHIVHVGMLEVRLFPYGETWQAKFSVICDAIFSHMNEEEEILFPKMQEVLNVDELDRLGNEANDLRA